MMKIFTKFMKNKNRGHHKKYKNKNKNFVSNYKCYGYGETSHVKTDTSLLNLVQDHHSQTRDADYSSSGLRGVYWNSTSKNGFCFYTKVYHFV